MAAVRPFPCSLPSFSISSIAPHFSPTTESPPRDTVAAFVPFLWEEKPGISKQNRYGADNVANSKLSSNQPELLQHFVRDLDVLPLPMPPRLQKPSGFELRKTEGTDFTSWRSHEQKRSLAGSSLKKRQPRNEKAEDDPFLRAIQACTAINAAESKRERKFSRSSLLQKLFEDEDGVFPPNKTSSRASHAGKSADSLSTEAKPALSLNARQGDLRQLLQEQRFRSSGELRRYTDQRKLSTPRPKSGVMDLHQKRLIPVSCLGCRNPQGYDPSAILARAKVSASNSK